MGELLCQLRLMEATWFMKLNLTMDIGICLSTKILKCFQWKEYQTRPKLRSTCNVEKVEQYRISMRDKAGKKAIKSKCIINNMIFGMKERSQAAFSIKKANIG